MVLGVYWRPRTFGEILVPLGHEGYLLVGAGGEAAFEG
jgi:hypothetical protein